MDLGQNVKYKNEAGDEILAVIQGKLSSGEIIICLPGGITKSVSIDNLYAKLSID